MKFTGFLILVIVSVVAQCVLGQMPLWRCRLVKPGTTRCTDAEATSCQDEEYLAELISENRTQVPVCSCFSETPRNSYIDISFRMAGLNAMYRPFMSLPSICFMPQLNETRTCPDLAAIPDYTRTPCTNFEALKQRLVCNPPSAKLCILNPESTPMVYREQKVTVYAKLGEPVVPWK